MRGSFVQKLTSVDGSIDVCGFAAAQCGKALPYRCSLSRIPGGYASFTRQSLMKETNSARRKGAAFSAVCGGVAARAKDSIRVNWGDRQCVPNGTVASIKQKTKPQTAFSLFAFRP